MKTPNYVLTQAHNYSNGAGDPRTLPEGSFVRPIIPAYVPKHVLEEPRNRGFDPKTELFIFCRFGIIIVPKHIVRET